MTRRLAFPLISRRRLVGTPFGAQRSTRRGRGGETAGTRPYVPGDPIATIEWVASARLSAARGADEFIVREQYSEEAPVVAIVLDHRPSMGLYPPPSPWLDKRATAAIAVRAIVESADDARAVVGVFDEARVATRLLPPAHGRVRLVGARVAATTMTAPASALDDGVQRLVRNRRSLPPGSFVFLVSDFLGSFGAASRTALRGLGADIVPVVVQDPTWERSFPDVAGVLLPAVDVESGELHPARLTRGETRARMAEHEQRYAELTERFRKTGMDPVTLDDADPELIHHAFLGWAARRKRTQRRVR
ncbi:MAG TPA: DUF58 domain-containing protein [Gaiellales bacterium]